MTNPNEPDAVVAGIIGDYVAFVTQILEQVAQLGIDVSTYQLDHICYRVDHNDKYAAKKEQLAPLADLLVENLIGGRLIATYKLHKPLVVQVHPQPPHK
jgi:uncharacterized protein